MKKIRIIGLMSLVIAAGLVSIIVVPLVVDYYNAGVIRNYINTAANGAKLTSIPIQSPNGFTPFISGKIGDRSILFLLDTGAGINTLTPNTASAVGMERNGRKLEVTFHGTEFNIPFSIVPHNGIGMRAFIQYSSMLITKRRLWLNYEPLGIRQCTHFKYAWWRGLGMRLILPGFPVDINNKIQYVATDTGTPEGLFFWRPFPTPTMHRQRGLLFDGPGTIWITNPRLALIKLYVAFGQRNDQVYRYGVSMVHGSLGPMYWVRQYAATGDMDLLGWEAIRSIGDLYINYTTQQECFLVKGPGGFYVAQPRYKPPSKNLVNHES